MKKKAIALMLALTLCTHITVQAKMEETIYSKGAVLIEKESKRILYEREAKDKLAMASTTKIMTCILALEKGHLDDVVTVSARAAQAPKVKLYLKTGEKQYLGDLLYSLMLESHNDSAVAIAEHIGGTVENFCQMMTDKAKAIGATNTCFQTPNGLDGEKHYATPYDMALITAYALELPAFIEITNTLDKHIPYKELEGSKEHDLVNKNRFIREYNGAIGVKTGYTSKAGHCFVGAAEREDMTLIAVALGAGWNKDGKSRKYTDVKKMINYGFENYKKYTLINKEDLKETVSVKKGKVDEVTLSYKDTIVLPLNNEEKERVQIQKTINQHIVAPVEKQQEIGKASVVLDGQIIAQTPLVAAHPVEKANLFDYMKKMFKKNQ